MRISRTQKIYSLLKWWCECACVSSSSLKHLPSLLSNTHGRTPGVFMFDKKIRASFQTLSKLLIIYRASPLWVQSKVEKAPLPRGNEWSHTQIALMLPESSPSQTCFRTPHWASLLWTHWVIPGAPGWLSHFFQQISHRLSDIYARARLHCTTFVPTHSTL